jgi:hypothetical protein
MTGRKWPNVPFGRYGRKPHDRRGRMSLDLTGGEFNAGVQFCASGGLNILCRSLKRQKRNSAEQRVTDPTRNIEKHPQNL